MKTHLHRMYVLALFMVLALPLAAQQAATDIKPEPKSFDSNGVKIVYDVYGEGEPVLLIHGFTASVQMQWTSPGITMPLAERYQVIALDNRGHGRSDKPHDPEKYGMEMVEDAVRLLDHLGIEKAHVAGYSMGGLITMKLIATHPDRIKSAIVGGMGWMTEDDEGAMRMNELAEGLETNGDFSVLFRGLTPEGKEPPTEQQIQMINRMMAQMNDPKALAAVVRGFPRMQVTEEQLRANKVPTLALIGGIDPLKRGVDRMDGVMANLQIKVIEGQDHMTAFTQAEFLDAMLKFYAEHDDNPKDS